MTPAAMQFAAVCFSGLACLISAFACWTSYRAFRRQGEWKDSDDARAMYANVQKAVNVGEQLDVRVSKAEAVAHKLGDGLADSKRLDLEAETKQRLLELKIETLQRHLDGLPSREEVTRLEGKVDRGFERLEGSIKLESALMTRVETTLSRVEEGLRNSR